MAALQEQQLKEQQQQLAQQQANEEKSKGKKDAKKGKGKETVSDDPSLSAMLIIYRIRREYNTLK